jgi:hypothetical protein
MGKSVTPNEPGGDGNYLERGEKQERTPRGVRSFTAVGLTQLPSLIRSILRDLA